MPPKPFVLLEGLRTGLVLQACDRKQQLHALLKPVLPHSSLEEWKSEQPLVCIDFGSMGCMGLIPDPHHLVAVLVAALHFAGAKGILLTGIRLLPFSPVVFQQGKPSGLSRNCGDLAALALRS